MDFLWNKINGKPNFPKLKGDINTDVLIIGGGMAGVLCAKHLETAGVDYVLAEAATIGNGITKGTTAVLTAQHDTLYQDIIKKYGFNKAKQYLSANLRAVESFKSLSREIDCELEIKPSIMFSLHDKTLMQNEANAVRSLGYNAEFITDIPLSVPAVGAVCYPDMAQFHPLKFLYAIAKNLNIFENTFVHKLKDNVAFTDSGNIYAKKVIVATHFPFINTHGMYFMKLYQHRSYVIAYENAPNLECTIEDYADNGIYLRNYENLLIIGGGDHRTGEKGGGYETIRSFARRYFPMAKEKLRWSNQDCITLDGIPYIGRYSKLLPNVYVATGFGLWGMTTSMAAARILCDLVQGKENENAAVFLPDRSIWHTQLFKNAGATAVNFITPTAKRCPHLGCALKWNSLEHSWDCPCHGSRFGENGELINNPAMKDSRVK